LEQASEAGEASQPVTAAHGDEAKRLQEMLKQYKRLLDESDSPLSLLWQFLIPFEGEYFAALAWYEQVYEVLKVPIVILLKLTIPIVDQELPNEGWIRPVATLQMFFFPLLLTGFVLVQDLGWLPDGWLSLSALAMVWGVTLCVSIAVATLVWTSSVDNKEPEFWRWMGFVGFVGALMIIYTTAKEIVNVILAFGVVFEVGTLLLGVTILAVGIGMQDLVTCVGVARAGYATMAASACVGCAMMNIFLGLGLAGILGPLLVEDPYRLYISVQLLCCLGFMLVSIIVAILTIVAWDGQAGRVFGVLMVSLYVLFIVISVIVDVFGADVGNSLVERVAVDG
jgi:sodium/potassium/calcium exchanger 6